MLSKKEKEIIEDLKECENCHYKDKENCLCEVNYVYKRIILGIIDKQQKEIKELKSKTQIISPLYIKENYISKEAIREKIKELEQVKYDEGKYDEKNSIYGYIYEFSKSYEYEVAQIIIKILKELLGE